MRASGTTLGGRGGGRDSARRTMEWEPALPFLVKERTLNDPMLQASWGSTISRLTISIPHTRDMKNITLTVREAT